MTSLAETRHELQRVATQILARRRHAACGRFGLRATPGGIGTPAFGPPEAIEVVRTSGTSLVHEVGGDVRSHPIENASLADLAAFVGVDLAVPFSVGRDTPEVGDPTTAIALDPVTVTELADWFHLGWRALDRVTELADQPDAVQLWPEHFDAGTIVAVGAGPNDRLNLGASPGDHHHDEPYLYVQPWTDARPGDPSFWNISFGAVLPRTSVESVDAAVAFFTTGLRQFA